MQFDGVTLRLPVLFFLLRAVVFAINVAHMMPAVPVGVGLQERRSLTRARSLHQARCDMVHRAHTLTLTRFSLDAEGGGAAENRSRGRLREMRVLVIKIVFAHVDHG